MARERLARRAVKAAGLPQDVMLGMPRIVLCGDSQMLLENHRGIVEYAQDRLRVRTALGVLTVEGENLTLCAMGQEDLQVTGTIRSVQL
ncbi:MAG TPA: sporulation protein YqfC [Candidatus Aphodomonas merdavium]|nr:sporulation protein YqfC [Candidatus Aphodomonas merdavium]